MSRDVYGKLIVGFEYDREDALEVVQTSSQCAKIDHRVKQGPGPRCSFCGQPFMVVETVKMKPQFKAFLKETFDMDRLSDSAKDDPWEWLLENDVDGLGLYTIQDEEDRSLEKTILGTVVTSASTYERTAKTDQKQLKDAFQEMKMYSTQLKVKTRPIAMWLSVHMS